jgi:hypothetical protein
MTKLLNLFDRVFGCHHEHISRPMKIDGVSEHSYVRCLICAAKMEVEWLDGTR